MTPSQRIRKWRANLTDEKKTKERKDARERMAAFREEMSEEERKNYRQKDKMRKRRDVAMKAVMKKEKEGKQLEKEETNIFKEKVEMEMKKREKVRETREELARKWKKEYEESKKKEYATWHPVVYEGSSLIGKGIKFGIVRKTQWFEETTSIIDIRVRSFVFNFVLQRNTRFTLVFSHLVSF